MLSALPSIDRRELFSRLAGGTGTAPTVVTSSRRLAQALARDFDRDRAGAGESAWSTPDFLPFASWVERFWSDALYSEVAPGLPLLLTEVQELAMWQDSIAATHADGLLSLHAAAQQAAQAWRLAHAWGLAGRLRETAEHVDTRAFVEWAARYERLTRERGQVDRARLPDAIAPLLESPSLRKPPAIVLAGFDVVTPQQVRLLQRLESFGSALLVLEPQVRDARTARVAFAKPAEEIDAAARWARARLEKDATARIGIIVPDLARSRNRVERVLARVMEPMRSLGADSPRPFNISLGMALDQWPIVRDALALLRLAGREIPFEEASAVLRSPFLAGAESERAARDALDASMRRRAAAEVTLDGVLRLMRRQNMPAAPRLSGLLERLDEYRRSDLFQRRGAAEWARAIEAALRHAGFPGERTLDSAEYQAWMKWHDALAAFAGLEQVMGSMSWSEACQRLARVAASIVFQPETPDVPVQVLGLLEATGLDFDALWVTGLSEDAWPMPPRPNAFIPLALQRSAGIPHADATASLALDERITAAWKRSAGEVVFSHSRMREDSEIGPSPLVSDIPEASLASLSVWEGAAPRDSMKRRGALQRIADGSGPAVTTGEQPGGTRLFRDQAACPFRAFARHRLDSAPLERPEPGLDPAARGTLMHEMLYNTWRELRDKARLDALSLEEREGLLARAADASLEKCGRFLGDALTGRFRALERERLIGTTREWLDLERRREPFEVVEIEEKREMTFGGITVKVKLDRMDAMAQGGRAVVDYKTGAAALSSWRGPRPDEPQVPMYTVGSGEDVRAVAFATLRRGEMGYCGFAMEKGLLPDVDVVEKKWRKPDDYRNWAAMLAGWRESLDILGSEFARGEARVAPKSTAACEQCDQHAFCRIAEKLDG